MTKAEYRSGRQGAPMGEDGLKAIRDIVKNQQYAKVNETAVDLFSASAVVRVYDSVNSANKAKILAMPVHRAIRVCLTALSK